ncbi:GNAT family N-acetyltransferase [Robiginitalea sp. IMCC43444]|uniref:GNAT family N-acetyltransferase n=1 Tax=Robiginitalea sp. IMCC43444 TaxID=3459121 RepID=UPI00404360BF
MIEIIRNKKEWNAVLSKCKVFDTYHTYEYHQLYKRDGQPVLLTYSSNRTVIALPLLIRTIPGTDFKDACSVYGYTGPISNLDDISFAPEAYQTELLTALKKLEIVTVFSRLHPFITGQRFLIKSLGKIEDTGKVVYVDLNLPEKTQFSAYNRRLKSYIRKGRSQFEVIQSNNAANIAIFKAIYEENMLRVGARPSYFFYEQYFKELLRSSEFTASLFLLKDLESGEVASGGILIEKNGFAHYHLSGTKREFLKESPSKLLIDEMRLKAMANGNHIYNLGGGKGAGNDSLFHFKSLFSKETKPFCTWKLIVDEKIFRALNVEQHSTNFFPPYRKA